MTALIQIYWESFGLEGGREYMEKRLARTRKKLGCSRSQGEFELTSDILDIWEKQLKDSAV